MSAKPEPEDTSMFVPLRDAWAKYEERKATLPKDLTPEEYRDACRQIADELGV